MKKLFFLFTLFICFSALTGSPSVSKFISSVKILISSSSPKISICNSSILALICSGVIVGSCCCGVSWVISGPNHQSFIFFFIDLPNFISPGPAVAAIRAPPPRLPNATAVTAGAAWNNPIATAPNPTIPNVLISFLFIEVQVPPLRILFALCGLFLFYRDTFSAIN